MSMLPPVLRERVHPVITHCSKIADVALDRRVGRCGLG